MVYINDQDYLERKTKSKSIGGNQASKRSWWFGTTNIIGLGHLTIPERLQGKRFKLKVEVIEQKKKRDLMKWWKNEKEEG